MFGLNRKKKQRQNRIKKALIAGGIIAGGAGLVVASRNVKSFYRTSKSGKNVFVKSHVKKINVDQKNLSKSQKTTPIINNKKQTSTSSKDSAKNVSLKSRVNDELKTNKVFVEIYKNKPQLFDDDFYKKYDDYIQEEKKYNSRGENAVDYFTEGNYEKYQTAQKNFWGKFMKIMDEYNRNNKNFSLFLCDVVEFGFFGFDNMKDFVRHFNKKDNNNFISDFSTPLPKVSNWSTRIAKIGENPVGKIFLKNAQKVDRYNQAGKLLKSTNGIADSGKTLRKTPFAIAGGLGVAYGGYRAKKTYDKYKPEIQTGRKLMRTYNQFKNMFNKENN